jgi:uncharacterized membrane protein
MSDEKKLSDDLEDMLGDAKEGVKKAAEKAEDFAKDAKEKTSEFVEDAKETLSEGNGKGVAIIAHITLIGWVIALIMNSSNKTELGSFYIRQVLGLMLFSLLSWIPVLGWIIGLVCLVLWVVSLINSIGGKLTPIPIVGEKFQEWFKSI